MGCGIVDDPAGYFWIDIQYTGTNSIPKVLDPKLIVHTMKVPLCRRCKRTIFWPAWVVRTVFGLILATACGLLLYYSNPEQFSWVFWIISPCMMTGFVLVLVLYCWRCFFPQWTRLNMQIRVTVRGDDVFYRFRDHEIAEEFARLNDAHVIAITND